MPLNTVATRFGARIAAVRTAAQPTGLRLWGIVDDPPLARRSQFGQFADFSLHLQRDIAGYLPKRANQHAEARGHLCNAVALGMPRK